MPHELTERRKDELRRRAGNAYLLLGAGSVEIASVLGFRSHASVSRRMQGRDGPLAALLMEIDRLERAGYDTTPVAVAIVDVQMAARQAHDSSCLKDLAIAEQELDGGEDMAAVRSGHGREWVAALERYYVWLAQHLPTLKRAVAS